VRGEGGMEGQENPTKRKKQDGMASVRREGTIWTLEKGQGETGEENDDAAGSEEDHWKIERSNKKNGTRAFGRRTAVNKEQSAGVRRPCERTRYYAPGKKKIRPASVYGKGGGSKAARGKTGL